MATEESAPQKPEKPSAPPKRRLFPPFLVTFIVIVCVGFIVLLQGFPERLDDVAVLDRATLNILTLLAGFIGVLALGIWYLFSSGYPLALRGVTFLAVVGGIAAFFSNYELVAVDADLVPTFRRRGAPTADAKLKKPPAESGEVDLITTSGADFPQFLGPNRDGVVVGVALEPDWKANPPEEIWRQDIGAGHSAFAAVNGFAVTMEQRGKEEFVSCYAVKDGKWMWGHSTEARHYTVMGDAGPRGTPTIHNGRVYALGATGVLRCLNGKDGELIWSQDLLKEFGVKDAEEDMAGVAWGRSASPLIVDDVVIVPAGGPKEGPHVSLVAYDLESGEEQWRTGEQQISYSSPMLTNLGGVRQVVIVNESSVSGHFFDMQGSGEDRTLGEELWSFDWEGSSTAGANSSQPHFLGDDHILVTKGYGKGAAVFRIQNGDGGFTSEPIWHKPNVLKTKFTNVVVHDGHAYGLSDGILECAELESGKRRWKKRGRFGHGQVLLADDLLLVLGEDGTLTLLEASPKAGPELGQIQVLEGRTWNNMCLYGEFLLVRNSTEAACYKLTLKEPRVKAGTEPPPEAQE